MTPPRKVLVTGASGFVGSALVEQICRRGNFQAIAACRTASKARGGVVHRHHDLLDFAHLPKLDDIDTVIHVAARVHIMKKGPSDLESFRAANVQGTVTLARQAAAAGVRRFIYVSSVKVNGEHTSPQKPFSAFDSPMPVDAYGISKHEAEQQLQALTRDTQMQLVVVRPPLVYGPGVKANFRTLMACIARRLPLPLGAIDNRRSLVAIDNLVDLLITCIEHPGAAGQTFLVSDDNDVSTTQLLNSLARSMQVTPLLLPIPVLALKMAAAMIGKSEQARRVLESLQVDIRHTRERLGWAPPVSMEAAIQQTASDYLATSRSAS